MKFKNNDDIIMRKEVVVCDWDGVLQFIERNWCLAIRELFPFFKEYFDEEKLKTLGKPEFIHQMLNREEYYLNDYLLKDKNNPLPVELFDLFMQAYTKPIRFYEGCNFTDFYSSLLSMANQNTFKEIIILTHVPFENGIDVRKESIFNRYFKSVSGKFKLVQIHNSYPKWKYLVDNNISYTIFVDDRADIIKDVAMNTNCDEKQFWMPQYAYNKYLTQDQEFLDYLEIHNAELYTFPVKLLQPFSEEQIKSY